VYFVLHTALCIPNCVQYVHSTCGRNVHNSGFPSCNAACRAPHCTTGVTLPRRRRSRKKPSCLSRAFQHVEQDATTPRCRCLSFVAEPDVATSPQMDHPQNNQGEFGFKILTLMFVHPPVA